MRKTFIIGGLIFLVFAVFLAPAGLVRTAFDQVPGAVLTEPSGTLWEGSGRIFVNEQALGIVAWDFRPAGIFSGSLSYDISVTGPEHDVSGNIAVTPSRLTVLASGEIDTAVINRGLAHYDIAVAGTLELDAVQITLIDGYPGEATGSVHWSGGSVRYTLSGRTSSATLPPLVAYLDDTPTGIHATVFAKPGQTPLIEAQLLENGFAKIGITKLLTKLLNNPWPGSDPDHAIVLEVEEQVL